MVFNKLRKAQQKLRAGHPVIASNDAPSYFLGAERLYVPVLVIVPEPVPKCNSIDGARAHFIYGSLGTADRQPPTTLKTNQAIPQPESKAILPLEPRFASSDYDRAEDPLPILFRDSEGMPLVCIV
jgi:hypothetical protein